MELLSVIIETERLILKPISYDFAENIFNEFSEEIAIYMVPKPAKHIDETNIFIKHSLKGLEDGVNLQMIILNKKSNEFIGCISINDIGKIDPELGIWLKKTSHKSGYGLEAMNELIKWANENIEFEYLKYSVDKRNISSIKIAEKNNGKIMREYKNTGMGGNELEYLEYWIYPKIDKV